MAKSASSSEYLYRLAVLLTGGLPAALPATERDAVSATAEPTRPTFLLEDRHRALFAQLAELPLEQRRVLVLRYFGDHSDREIAILLRMPQPDVRSHAQRALGKLRSTAIPSRDRSPRDPQTLLSELRSDDLWNLPVVPEQVTAPRRSRSWLLAIPAVAIIALVAVLVIPMLTPAPTEAEPPTVQLSVDVPDNGELVVNDRGITVSDFPRLEPAALVGNASTPWAVLDSSPTTAKLRIVYVFAAEPEASCGTHLGISVEETDSTVRIAVVGSLPKEKTDCITNAGYAGGTVYLDKALGDRQLIHAGLSSPWDSLDTPIITAPRPVEVTPEPVAYQDKVYLTSEGMGDLRIGQKITSTTLLTHLDDAGCAQWKASLPAAGSSDEAVPYRVYTADAALDTPILLIAVQTRDIPTKSGARVGDTEQSLLDRFPNLGMPVESGDGSTVYVIEGTIGKVLFYVRDGLVEQMQAVSIGAHVPYNGEGTGCGGA